MSIEELMDLQEAGSRACLLGLKSYEKPYLSAEQLPTGDAMGRDDRVARHDAWRFGWEAEQASREGKIAQHFRDLVRPRSRPLAAAMPWSDNT